MLSFGGGLFDYDNDGRLDVFIANGHVSPEVERATPEVHYKQINTLFSQRAQRKICGDYEAVRAGLRNFSRWAVDWHLPIFDNDGFIDVLVANGDVPLLLHNSGGNGNQFLNFKH